MGKANFTEDFKRDVVLQVTERGYPVAEVAARLGISKYSLYEWKKRYAKPAAATRDDDQAAEVRRLKRERIRRKVYRTWDEARADVFDYIEMFYNPTRKHARNGMLSPVEFERQHKARAEGV